MLGLPLTNLTSASAPNGLAVDSTGNIYVSGSRNNVIRKIAASLGMLTVTTGNGVVRME